MNKPDLVTALSEKLDIVRKEAERVVDALAEVVNETIDAGEDIRLHGIGKLYIVNRKARVGQAKGANGTRERYAIPARKGLKFKPSEALVKMVRGE